MNLLEETLHLFKCKGLTEENVAYVEDGKNDLRISFEDFKKVSKNFSYNSGFGSQEVNPKLEIVFKDGSFALREEYDGSEWWRYCPTRDPEKFLYCKDLKDFYLGGKDYDYEKPLMDYREVITWVEAEKGIYRFIGYYNGWDSEPSIDTKRLRHSFSGDTIANEIEIKRFGSKEWTKPYLNIYLEDFK